MRVINLLGVASLLLSGCSFFEVSHAEDIKEVANAMGKVYSFDDEYEDAGNGTVFYGNGTFIYANRDAVDMFVVEDGVIGSLTFYFTDNFLAGDMTVDDFYVSYTNVEDEVYYNINFDGDGTWNSNRTLDEFVAWVNEFTVSDILTFIEENKSNFD